MTEFTPGPWHYRPNDFDDWGWVRGGPEGAFVAMARGGKYETEEELDNHRARRTDPWEANARLIVRAPTMDAAIRNYLATFDACGGSESVSAERFAEAREMLRKSLVHGECVPAEKTK